MRDHLVTVITASYNYATYIAETIEAVLNQSHSNIQYIIVDDHSTDDSNEIISCYQKHDSRIKHICMPTNTGGPPAYAEACKYIEGDFICCIDADDVILNKKLEQQLNFFQSNSDYDLCTTYVEVIDSAGNLIPSPNAWEAWSNVDRNLSDLSVWLTNNYVAHSAVMMTRKSHDHIGPLDLDMKYAPDFEHWVRFVSNNYKFGILKNKLLRYRLHDKNHTHTNRNGTFFESVYIFWRHILPKFIEQGNFQDIKVRLSYVVNDAQYKTLPENERMKLLATILSPPSDSMTYKDFRQMIVNASPQSTKVLEILLST